MRHAWAVQPGVFTPLWKNSQAVSVTGYTAFRWLSYCTSCGRRSELESRPEHHAKTLCDRCASTPLPTPTPPGRREADCDGCGHHTATEFSLELDARFCDRCYWQAIRAREGR